MLLDSIKRHPLSFFADQWTVKGPKPSAEYESEVLALDPKGRNDALRGSIAWLRGMGVLTAEDEKAFRRVNDARNEIAHEMTAMVSGSKPSDFTNQFAAVMALVHKIEKWWIINVEISADPEFAGREIDEDGIVPGPVLVMQILGQVALGEGEEAWELHRKFSELRPDEGHHD